MGCCGHFSGCEVKHFLCLWMTQRRGNCLAGGLPVFSFFFSSPFIIHSLCFLTPPPLSFNHRTPPFTNHSDSWGLTPVTFQGYFPLKHKQTGGLPPVHTCLNVNSYNRHACNKPPHEKKYIQILRTKKKRKRNSIWFNNDFCYLDLWCRFLLPFSFVNKEPEAVFWCRPKCFLGIGSNPS